jgi:hypothetical protein
MAASTNAPWNAMWTMSPGSNPWADAGRGFGLGAMTGVGPAAWPVDPLELATAGLETWRWLVNAQVDLAVNTLSALRR